MSLSSSFQSYHFLRQETKNRNSYPKGKCLSRRHAGGRGWPQRQLLPPSCHSKLKQWNGVLEPGCSNSTEKNACPCWVYPGCIWLPSAPSPTTTCLKAIPPPPPSTHKPILALKTSTPSPLSASPQVLAGQGPSLGFTSSLFSTSFGEAYYVSLTKRGTKMSYIPQAHNQEREFCQKANSPSLWEVTGMSL